MSCGGCVASVTRALQQVPGVTEVQVDLDAKQATVSGTADRAAVVAAIEDAGFEVPDQG